jgi:hypothetical protein
MGGIGQNLVKLEQVQISKTCRQIEGVEIKYQNIIYCMINRNKRIRYGDQVQIDFVKAVNELKSLDHTYQENGISFINLKTNENLFCSKMQKDKWFILTPLLNNGVYQGYQWTSYPHTESLINTTRLFFEEMNWLHSQDWKAIKWKSDFEK